MPHSSTRKPFKLAFYLAMASYLHFLIHGCPILMMHFKGEGCSLSFCELECPPFHGCERNKVSFARLRVRVSFPLALAFFLPSFVHHSPAGAREGCLLGCRLECRPCQACRVCPLGPGWRQPARGLAFNFVGCALF